MKGEHKTTLWLGTPGNIHSSTECRVRGGVEWMTYGVQLASISARTRRQVYCFKATGTLPSKHNLFEKEGLKSLGEYNFTYA